MEYMEKAALVQGKKKREIAKISFIAAICVVGILLGAYNVYDTRYIYAILYFVAAFMGFAYVIIKINTISPVYVAANRDMIYMQCWDNRAFAYRIDFKPAFFTDFIPAKVEREEIPVSKIKGVFVGNCNYLERNLAQDDFEKHIKKISTRRTEIEALKKMDFLCIERENEKLSFMSINDIEKDALARIINLIYRKNPEVKIKCNLREIYSGLTYDKNK